MLRRLSLIVLAALILAACGGQTAATEPTAAPTEAPAVTEPAVTNAPTTVAQPTAEVDRELRTITLAMSYIPNVQFAPYYVAAAKGYYAEAGLDVQFDYNFENDVVARVATWPQGNVAFATASGTSTLLARQQSIPVKTVYTQYQQFPIVFFAKAATGLDGAEALRDKSIGIPGNFGESLYALLAVAYAEGIDRSALNVQEIGFTQAQSVLEDRVQVGIGYAMNEPLLLQQQGEEVDVLRVADIYNLAANGIVASEQLIAEEPELVRGFVAASLRGLRDTLDNPDEAFELSLGFIPEANLGDVELQREVLLASLPYWESEATATNGLGFTDEAVWARTEQFMREAGLLAGPVPVAEAFTNEFIK